MIKHILTTTLFFLYASITFATESNENMKKIGIKETAIELDTFVKELVNKDKFSGAILLSKVDKILYKAAFGLASKRFNIPNNQQTKFNLASMNKMFTAIAIMQLVESKKLSLTDKLSSFVDETWLPKTITNKIEIQHLLTHSSGLGSFFNKDFMASSRGLFRSLSDYKKLTQNESLQFEPGKGNRYSNTGMLMLGVVIEKVSTQNYFDYIRENIYKRAGMVNTDSYEMDQPVANLAIGYIPTDNDTGWTNNLFMHVIKGGPAGGGYSTIEDLYQFALALTNYKLLNKKHTEQLYSAKPQLQSPSYGYGFRVSGASGNRVVGHNGGFPGIDTNLDIYLDKGYVSIVLSNYWRAATPVISKISELVDRTKQ